MNKFSCYHCGKHLAFRLDQFGKWMKCPKCQKEIQIGASKPPVKESGGSAALAATLFTPSRLRVGLVSVLWVAAVVLLWRAFF